ncbi:MAG: anti-sigma factor antagonist [Oscillospiraceae bacterium]|nr:anti-sigma factor antagonist [Oscillospiraceae bacterium]
MQIKLAGEKHTIILKICGELDHHIASDIAARCDEALIKSNAINIIFDFSELSFMDSSGIGTIMGRYKKINGFGGNVVIAAPTSQVMRLITISGLKRIIKVTTSVENALKLI